MDSTPKLNGKWVEKRIGLGRQHFKEWQVHLASETQLRYKLRQRHRSELDQLRSSPFTFRQQSALVQQQVQELNQLRATNQQQRQTIGGGQHSYEMFHRAALNSKITRLAIIDRLR